jgi:hypothetical protein
MLDDLDGLGFNDPEGWYVHSFCLLVNGATEPALDYVTRAVDGGYVCHEALAHRPEWTALTDPRYHALVERTSALAAQNRALYEAAQGPSILSGPIPQSARGSGPSNR